MAAKDQFPSFSEICKSARDIEKTAISPAPSKISGELHPGEAASIFPREYEEYTYALLLSEAHKVERKLFAASYAGTLGSQQPGAVPPQIDERKIELAAHQVSDYEIGSQQKKEGIGGHFSRLRGMFGQKEERLAPPSQPVQQRQDALPSGEQIPAEVLMAREERMLRNRVQPQQAPAGQTPEESAAEKRRGLVPEEAEDEEFEKEAPHPETPEDESGKPDLQRKEISDEGELEKPPSAQEQEGAPAAPAPVSKLASSSKLSPRLRAIIEEKLKREEEKERLERGSGKEGQPEEAKAPRGEEAEMPSPLRRRMGEGRKLPARPQEGQPEEAQAGEKPDEPLAAPGNEEEKIYFSARERLLAKLQKQKGKEPPVRGKEEAEIPSEEEKTREEEGQEEAEEPEEKEEQPRAGQTPAEEEKPSPALRASSPFAQKGGIQIKPIFSEEAQEKKEEEPRIDQETAEELETEAKQKAAPSSEDEESDERMAKIQRIIDELSPDKFRSNLGKKQSPEKGEGKPRMKAKREMPEEEEEPEEKPKMKVKDELPEEGEPEEEGEPAQKIPVSKQKLQQKTAPTVKKGKEKTAVKKSPPEKFIPEKKAAAKKIAQGEKMGPRILPQKKPAQPPEEEEPAKKAPQRVLPQRKEEAPSAQKRVFPQKKAAEEAAEEAPRRVLPQKKLQPTVQMVAPKYPQQAGDAAAGQQAKPRVLPGAMSGLRPLSRSERTPAPKTYVPPVRQKAAPEEEGAPEGQSGQEEPEAQHEGQEEKETQGQQQKEEAPKKQVPVVSLPKQPAKLTPEERLLLTRPKKQVLDEPMDEPPSPEQVAEEKRVRQRGEHLSHLAKPHDIAGEAKLPAQGEEDDLSVPRPPSAEEETPRPQDYAQAKERLRHREQQEEIVESAKKENEDMLEQYAKDNLTWLYEIYKMGGIAREAFMQKVQEKIDEEKGAGEIGSIETQPENPALSNLGKSLEKKKKWPF